MNVSELCTEKNYRYSDWCSDFYRSRINIGGSERLLDIRHISLPFDRVKETAYKTRHSLDDGQVQLFYKSFASNLRRSWNTEDRLKERHDADTDSCVIYREGVYVSKKPDTRGSDIYILYEPSEPAVPGIRIADEGASVHDILETAVHIVEIVRLLSADSLHCTSVDTSSIRFKDGQLQLEGLHCFSDETGQVHMTPDMCLHAKRVSGAIPAAADKSTDYHFLCSMLWSMLDGRHFDTAPDMSVRPKCASERLSRVLASVMETGEDAYVMLSDALKGELENCGDRFISFEPPACGLPDYTPEFHIGDEIAKARLADEERSDSYEDYRSRYDGDESLPGRSRWKGIAAAAAAAVVAAVILFVSLPLLGIRIFSKEMHHEYRMSSTDGIYVLYGAAVDADAESLGSYSVDDSGNILLAETGSVVYPKEYAAEYILLDDARLDVLSRQFITYPSLSDFPLKSYVIDLRDVPDCRIDGYTGQLYVPASLQELQSGSIVMVSTEGNDQGVMIADKTVSLTPGFNVYSVGTSEPETAEIYNGKPEDLADAAEYDSGEFSHRADYLGGQWTYVCRITALPDNSTERKIRISAGTSEMSVRSDSDNYTDCIETELSAGRQAVFTVASSCEGEYSIRVEGLLGGLKKEFPVSFPGSEREINFSIPVETYSPASVPEPSATPSPVPSPHIVQHIPQPYSPAVQTDSPIQTSESSEFTISETSLLMSAGERHSVVTSGDDGGYIRVYSSDESVATVEISGGTDGCYTVHAVGEGKCIITFITPGDERIITVNVR